ncbi:hypothetical protein AB4Y32_37755 [Paraburkholderia phymatum]|uniref:Uncharacterized protein n=1 Tax=Paraburkholderia phymatum TaxID=148447 RepID=A0ACC6UD54_9BURK
MKQQFEICGDNTFTFRSGGYNAFLRPVRGESDWKLDWTWSIKKVALTRIHVIDGKSRVEPRIVTVSEGCADSAADAQRDILACLVRLSDSDAGSESVLDHVDDGHAADRS